MTVTGQPAAIVDLPPLARALLDQVADGVVAFDGTGRVLFVNEAALVVLGLARRPDYDPQFVRERAVAQGGRVAPLDLEGRGVGEVIVLRGGDGGTLAERERSAILQALELTGGRLTETARRLGISRTTLWRRLKAYGLERHDRWGR